MSLVGTQRDMPSRQQDVEGERREKAGLEVKPDALLASKP